MADSEYSPIVGGIFIYNLLVGTGALALPSVLGSAGWVLGSLFLLFICFFSFVSLTFVVESMAAANALLLLLNKGLNGALEENQPLNGGSQIFLIAQCTEFGQMAELFFNWWGLSCFYIALILYLYGDLAIYSTIVGESILGAFYKGNASSWTFDIFLSVFLVIMLPFCLYNFQKTKSWQMVAMVLRNISLYMMILLAFVASAQDVKPDSQVPAFNIKALPNLFGGVVYAFMCHHSIPGILTPIKNKANILRISGIAFSVVLTTYLLLFISCDLAFGLNVKDPVTFNFPPERYHLFGHFLIFFPVITMTFNFPLISITLRNNLDSLGHLILPRGLVLRGSTFWRRRILLAFLAVIPPIAFSSIAKHYGVSLDQLVGLTGGFAGCAVMFIIPSALAFCSRRILEKEYQNMDGHLVKQLPINMHASPFKGSKWICAMLFWAVVTVVLVGFQRISRIQI